VDRAERHYFENQHVQSALQQVGFLDGHCVSWVQMMRRANDIYKKVASPG
jgi:hypothetical protein